MSTTPFAVLAMALAVAAVAGIGVAGCGKTVVDDVKLEETLKDNVESSRGEKVKSVDCPTDIEVKAKTEFECTIIPEKGKKETAVLRIKNEDADIEVVEIKSGDVDLSLGG
jgi:NAD/NADP transhydrogenase alpha subunit